MRLSAILGVALGIQSCCLVSVNYCCNGMALTCGQCVDGVVAHLDVCCRSIDSTFKAELEVGSIVISIISTSLLRLLEAVGEDVDVVMASGVDSSMWMESVLSPIVNRYIMSSKEANCICWTRCSDV